MSTAPTQEPAANLPPPPEPHRVRAADLAAALDCLGPLAGIDGSPCRAWLARAGDAPRTLAEWARLALDRAPARWQPVRLDASWWRRDAGPLLTTQGSGNSAVPVVLAWRAGAYDLLSPRTGGARRLTAADRAELAPDGYSFTRPLPGSCTSLGSALRWAATASSGPLGAALLAAAMGTLLGISLPVASRALVGVALPLADRKLLVDLALLLVAVNLAQATFRAVEQLAAIRFLTRALSAAQAGLWDRLLRLPVNFFRRYSSGDLVHRAMLVTQISDRLGTTVVRSLLSGVLTVVHLGVMLWLSPWLTLVTAPLPLFGALAAAALAVRARRQAIELEQLRGRLLGYFVQLVGGIGKLRVAGALGRAFSQWAARHAETLPLLDRVRRLNDLGLWANTLAPQAATLALYAVASYTPAGGSSMPSAAPSLGDLVAFAAALGALSASLSVVAEALVEIASAAAQQRVAAPLLEAEPEVTHTAADPGPLVGHVAVSHVTFRYQPDRAPVLDDVSFEVRPGEFVALVGPSGSGKSTLFRLLLGFERPESGSVRFDHRDLWTLDLPLLRRQFGCVLQSSQVFAGTILENIAGGALLTLDEAWAAAHDAALADDLAALPMGLFTLVAERGANLSGGQRQRLLLARALAQRPRLLLLDEATHALDNQTQRAVVAGLVRRQVTRIAIAHRLSTIADADRIIVLEAGRVVEVGRYDELLRRDGTFARLARRQLL